MGKFIATANKSVTSNNLIVGNQYIVKPLSNGSNEVYDLHNNYIAMDRTDAFDDYESLERE